MACTCRTRSPIGAFARRPTLKRSQIGQIGQTVSATFDASAILAQTTNYASQAQAVASQASAFVNSSSDAQRQAAARAGLEAMNFIIPGAGTALDVALQQLPQAHGGPGTCASNPPSGPFDTSWPGYTTYTQGVGSYPAPAPGSFEDFADKLIVQNYELANNCFWSQARPYALVLASAIDAWNRAHAPSRQRTITRSTGTSFGVTLDPIQFALIMTLPECGGSFFGLDTSCWPSTLSFKINEGPLVVAHPVILHFGVKPPPPPIILHFGPAAAAAAAAKGSLTSDFAYWVAGVGARRVYGPFHR